MLDNEFFTKIGDELMGHRKCILVSLLVIILLFMVACNDKNGNAERTSNQGDTSTNTSNDNSQNYAKQLREGDVKSLVGFSFYDQIDYNKVEVLGHKNDNYTEICLLKNPANNNLQLKFIGFEGDRNFMAILCDKGDFFGIKIGVDTLDDLRDYLGGEADRFYKMTPAEGFRASVDGIEIDAYYECDNYAGMGIAINAEGKISLIYYHHTPFSYGDSLHN
jgi:hypothetical protein